MILLENVSMQYKDVAALNNINLHIKKGEFVFIVGPSGAGKSTLIKLLFREVSPSNGRVTVKGKNLAKLSRKEIAYFRRNLGIVFQDFRLIANLNVYDNVAFALRVTGASSRFIKARVPKVLKMVGLLKNAKKFPDELSGGEQQRVALARALANNPDIIIADEPTGNVDPQMSRDIVELLNVINGFGTTVLMITHQHDLVKEHPHRVVVLDKGTIRADGRLGGKSNGR